MRPLTRIIAVSLVGLLACIDSTDPSSGGKLTLRVLGPGSSAALDSGYVVVTGPTNKTMKATPGTTVTVDGLTPGSYTVALEGFRSGGVAYFGQTSGVNVVAGQNATANVTFPSFQPTIVSIPSYTVDGMFTMVFSQVAAAASYVVQADANPSFPNPQNTPIPAANTSPQISIPTTGPYYVRVLAVDPYGAKGLPSAASTVTTVTSVTVTPATATIDPTNTQQFSAVAKDAQGNPVTVTFFWASSNQNVALVDQAGLATGVAGGSATITALGLGLPGSATLTVNPAPAPVPTQLVFTTPPSSSTAGAAISPAVEVEVRDAGGSRVTAARNTVTLAIGTNAGSGTLSGTATVNAVNGIATFSGLSIDKAGTGYTLAASSTSLTGATSGGFDIAPGPAARLQFSVQPPAVVEGNSPLGVEVQIADNFGNVVPTATNPVTLEIGRRAMFGASARLLGTPTVPAVGGVAAFSNLRLDLAGAGYTLNARSGSLATAGSAEFTVRLTFTQIDAGGTHACGLTTNGSAYCWGLNSSGQLGIGTFVSDSVPRLVTGGLSFSQVSAGISHTCGVTASNTIYCWGSNGAGQLGIGSTGGSSPEPTQVTPATPLVFVQVSAGSDHTCATTTSGGLASGAYCWGNDGNGQLGDGTAGIGVDEPQLVSGGFLWKQITAGVALTCAIRSNDQAYCWGQNNEGETGNGGVITPQPTPQQVSATLSFAQITGGGNHACGLEPITNKIWCWGRNFEGQIGNGTPPGGAAVLSEVEISGQLAWSNVAAGSAHTCMIDGGTSLAYCVGGAANGKLGNNTVTPNISVREVVMGAHPFTALSLGTAFSCGVNAANGQVWCWGLASSGQLGNGAKLQRNTPVQIVQ